MLVKRLRPNDIFETLPCSVVTLGTALGVTDAEDIVYPEGLADDGYLSLRDMNTFIRAHVPVERRVNFRRGERPVLREFLRENTHRAIICVLGHYLYADKNTYTSFLKNGGDPVVSVWYLD